MLIQNNMYMKKLLSIVYALLVCVGLSAQSDRYEQRYNLLVSQFGPAGVGVETVLNNWEKVDSTNAKLLLGRFSYLFAKAQSTIVEKKYEKKYLGMDPALALKDSTGRDVYYYQVNTYDDELYGEAIKAADKAIAFHPRRLDFRFLKANAYIAYEKESPDMALSYLMALVDEFASSSGKWTFEGEDADSEFFQDAMQEYCYSLYVISTPSSLKSFKTLSEKLSAVYTENVEYINNIGSYYMIAVKDYKTALKYYNKVLKTHPDDYTALKNAVVAARRTNNLKAEKKYLEQMVKYGPEKEAALAQNRLNAIAK